MEGGIIAELVVSPQCVIEVLLIALGLVVDGAVSVPQLLVRLPLQRSFHAHWALIPEHHVGPSFDGFRSGFCIGFGIDALAYGVDQLLVCLDFSPAFIVVGVSAIVAEVTHAEAVESTAPAVISLESWVMISAVIPALAHLRPFQESFADLFLGILPLLSPW